jgi:hypothetical protein
MKKIVLISAITLGAISASQAGVRFGFGIGVPLVAPAPVVCSPPVVYQAPAPVYVAPAPVYQAPSVAYCPPPVVYVPAPTLYFGFGPGWHGCHRYGWGHYRGWHR